MPLLLKLCLSNFQNESRDYRELSAAVEAGYQIKVLAGVLNSPGESGSIDEVYGYEVHRFDPFTKMKESYVSTARAKKSILKKFKRFFLNFNFVIRWVKKTKSFHADVVSCHDLHTLFIGYLANVFLRKSKKAKLVYDSHEFELGRSVSRNFLLSLIIRYTERFLIKKSAFSIMVSDSIADEVTKIHKLKTRPLVIRSTPLKWMIDTSVCEMRRNEYLKQFNVEFEPFILLYHGLIRKDRGIDTLIKVVSMNKNIVGIALGYALDDTYLDEVKKLIDNHNVADRFILLPAIENNRIWEFVGAADVGVNFGLNVCMSHKYSLPNKLFENIQSLTPVIVANVPEMRKIIEHYNIGLTCDSSNLTDINTCVEKMRTDKELYLKYKSNLITAKDELCWENEKKGLVLAYKNLIAT